MAVPAAAQARQDAFRAAQKALAAFRQQQAPVRTHRAIGRLPIGVYLLLQAIVLPVLFCGTLLWAEPRILAFWRECILFWSDLLAIPLLSVREVVVTREVGLVWGGVAATTLPGTGMLLGTAAATGLAWIASYRLNGPRLPLKYLLRIVCAVQALALLFFFFLPSLFPYSISSHLLDVVRMGYVLLMATPVMLGFGYYVLDLGIASKVWHTLLILAYFIVLIPHQAVLHVLVLQHLSLLFMPVLYICFGAVFNVLIFVALYSWAASKMPAQAMAIQR